MGYLKQLIGTYGVTLQYPVDTELDPGDPALGRKAQTLREWTSFKGFIGDPNIPAQAMEASRLFPNTATLHASKELNDTLPVRWENRTYKILNAQRVTFMGDKCWRYSLVAEVING